MDVGWVRRGGVIEADADAWICPAPSKEPATTLTAAPPPKKDPATTTTASRNQAKLPAPATTGPLCGARKLVIFMVWPAGGNGRGGTVLVAAPSPARPADHRTAC